MFSSLTPSFLENEILLKFQFCSIKNIDSNIEQALKEDEQEEPQPAYRSM